MINGGQMIHIFFLPRYDIYKCFTFSASVRKRERDQFECLCACVRLCSCFALKLFEYSYLWEENKTGSTLEKNAKKHRIFFIRNVINSNRDRATMYLNIISYKYFVDYFLINYFLRMYWTVID